MNNFVKKECDCLKTIGWKQSICSKTDGTCWFDAIYMALFTPVKSRVYLLLGLANKYKIPLDQLYPCIDNNTISEKLKLIKTITESNSANKYMGSVMTSLTAFLSLLKQTPDKITNDKLLTYFDYISIYSLSHDNYEKEVPNNLILNDDTKIFVFTLRLNYNNMHKILYRYNNFVLVSILVITSESSHVVSIVSCKNDWYLFDNNRALKKLPILKIDAEIKDNIFILNKSIEQEFYYIDLNEQTTYYIYARE